MKDELKLSKFPKRYSNQEQAYKFLESIRWKNDVPCPHCGKGGAKFIAPQNGKRRTSSGKPTDRRIWRCGACGKHFSVLFGTIFEGSRVSLSKWLLAIHDLNADRDGINSSQLARKLGVTQKSAWLMARRIRFAVAHSPLKNKLRLRDLAGQTMKQNVTGPFRRRRSKYQKPLSLYGITELDLLKGLLKSPPVPKPRRRR